MGRRTSRVFQIVSGDAPSFFGLESIRSRIVLFAILAALLPTLVMAWLAYSQNKRSVTQNTAEELERVASQMARELDLWLKERLYDVRVFASSYEVAENLARLPAAGPVTPRSREAQARLSEYLTSVHQRFPDYDQLMVVGQGGAVMASSGEQADSARLPLEWRDGLAADQPVLGSPRWDATLQRAVMTVAVPISAPDARVLGAFAATLRFDALDELLGGLAPGETGAVYLVTGTGALIVASRGRSPADSTASLPPASLETLRATGMPAVQFVNYLGVDVVGAYQGVPRLDWGVVAEIPRREAFGQIAALRNQTVVLVLGVALVVGAISYWLGLLIARPLDRLTHGAVEVAEGDLAVDLPPSGGGEVGRLTEVFNFMVARLREGREQLERLSVTDGLTELHNRRYLIDRLQQEVNRSDRTGNPFAFVIMDVDHFKKVNDTYGHQAGDAILVDVAEILRDSVRQVDTVSRYGGEEFVALLPETGAEGAAEVAERIRQAVAGHVTRSDGQEIAVTASFGVAIYPRDGDDVDEVTSAADGALYKAKAAGRDRVVSVGEDPPPVTQAQA